MKHLGIPALCACLCACGGGEAASEVTVSVRADSLISTADTDLGYQVSVERFAVSLRDFRFVDYGATETAWLEGLSEMLIPSAHAHPGHVQGGDTLGVMEGRFAVDFLGDAELGKAQLLAADYDALDVGLSVFQESDGVLNDAMPLGLTMILSGTATRAGESVPFEVRVQAPEDRELIGIPFEFEVAADESRTLVLRFSTREPFRPDHHLFDGIDFATMAAPLILAANEREGADSFFVIQRRLLSHDYFEAILEEQP
ncbi:MAG: hypothetical protein AAF658_15835 [Myxococcota bacterium]